MTTDKETIHLNHFSVRILAQLLALGEWYGPGQLYRAGQILEEVLPDVPKEPMQGFQGTPTDAQVEEQKAWAKHPCDIVISVKQRETIAACVKFFENAKRLNPSIFLLPLLNVAGLKPEE